VKINQKFISIGRVQTSLLYLIYLRDKRIKDFVPELYFTIEAELNYNNTIFKGLHQLNPFHKDKEDEVKKIYQEIKDEKIAIIVNKSINSIPRKPPTPLNTSKALVLLTKNLKISPKLALNTMNSLYLNKIISYPRTDSDVYQSNFDDIQYLKKFSAHSLYGNYTTNLLNMNKTVPTKGKKDAGDHPPITPLESLELTSSRFENDTQKKVYNILARHYLALFGKDATESKTNLKLSIKHEPFKSRLVSLIAEGFLEIVPFLKPKYDTEIIITGNQIPINKIFFNEKETQPPPKYTDTTLLQLMERNNLGTKATRPIIIQILQDRKLITRDMRRYSITELGTFLIDNLKNIWLPFLEPGFTKSIEVLLDDIKEKKRKMKDVIDLVKNTFLDLFDKFLSNKSNLENQMNKIKENGTFVSQFKPKIKEFPTTSSMCPFCKTHQMKLIRTRKGTRFLACSNEECSKKYLSVPKRGRISILNTVCSDCGFNLFKVKMKKNNKFFSYYLCPQCWNEGLNNHSGKGFCSNCENYKIEHEKCVKK